jgi:hypothetical protein
MKVHLKPRSRFHFHNPLDYQCYFFCLRVKDEHAKALEEKFEIIHIGEVFSSKESSIKTDDNTYYYGYINATSMWNAVDVCRKDARNYIYNTYMKHFSHETIDCTTVCV